MRVRVTDIVSVLAMIFVAFFTVSHFPDLPARVAVHFDLYGHPNGWMSRDMAAWSMPVFSLVIFLIVRFVSGLVPRASKPRANDSSVAAVSMLTVLFVSALHIVVLRLALGHSTSINDSLWLLLGGLFVSLGLVLPRLRRNGFAGFRTPWSMTSDENWARTQRFGGAMMVVTGLVAAFCGTVLGAVGAIISIAAILIGSFLPILYSLRLARNGGSD